MAQPRRRTVIAQSPDQIAAALAFAHAASCPLRVFTAPWFVAGYGCFDPGAYWGRNTDVVLDCGADAGAAMGALRSGWKRLAFAGRADLRKKLADMATQLGAELIEPPQAPDLILPPGADAGAHLRDWAEKGDLEKGARK